MRRAAKILRTAAAVALAFFAAGQGPPTPSEYQIKAAYLYNFAKFIEWPSHGPDGRNPMSICVLGDDPFGSDLDLTLERKTVRGRALSLRRHEGPESPRGCQILFVASSERGRVRQILGSLKERGVLTVGETPGFAEAGGVINFVTEGKKLRFEINVDAAERAGLKVSSELLKLALIVRDRPEARKD